MSFIVNAAAGAYALTRERIRQGKEFGGYEDVRPDVDPRDQEEFLAQQRDGRTDEAYKKCLEAHGFVWLTIPQLPMLEGGVARREGEWRHAKLRLAFTPTDLAAGFPGGPEALDRHLKEEILARKVARGKVPKQVLRDARARK